MRQEGCFYSAGASLSPVAPGQEIKLEEWEKVEEVGGACQTPAGEKKGEACWFWNKVPGCRCQAARSSPPLPPTVDLADLSLLPAQRFLGGV